MEPKRLNKFISDAGFCSRREADKLIEQGRVTINGKIPEAGTKVTDKDKVRIDDQLLQVREEEPVFLIFNKPAGIATTTDLSVRNNIISALHYPASLQPAGFLDREAEGLMFLSNDSELARKITKADTRFEKEYVVAVDKLITSDFLSRISEGGIPTPGTTRKKNFVAKEGSTRFRIVLAPGTNHHVKRMVEALGYKVVHLQRTRIGNFTSAKLAVGMWRALTEAEVNSIKGVLSGKAGQGSSGHNRETDKFFRDDQPAGRRTTTQQGNSDKPARKRSASSGGGSRSRSGKAPGPADKGATGATGKKPASKGAASRSGVAKRAGRRSSPSKRS